MARRWANVATKRKLKRPINYNFHVLYFNFRILLHRRLWREWSVAHIVYISWSLLSLISFGLVESRIPWKRHKYLVKLKRKFSTFKGGTNNRLLLCAYVDTLGGTIKYKWPS